MRGLGQWSLPATGAYPDISEARGKKLCQSQSEVQHYSEDPGQVTD